MKPRPVLALALGLCAAGCSPAGGADAGTDPDPADAAGRIFDAGLLDCFGLTNCTGTCSTPSCFQACAADSTPDAQYLDTTLQDCLATTCPVTDGGPCAEPLGSACQACTQNAQNGGQPCADDLAACVDDLSGAAGDLSGPGCNTLTTCLDSCQWISCEQNCIDSVSSLGYQLYTILSECLTLSCSEADGGPCVTQASSTCGNCQYAALNSGGACSTDYSNCMNSP